MLKSKLFWVFFVILTGSAVASGPTSAAETKKGRAKGQPYPLYPAIYQQVKEGLAAGDVKAAVEAIDQALPAVLAPPDPRKAAAAMSLKAGKGTKADKAAKPADDSKPTAAPITPKNQYQHLEQLLTLRAAAVTFAKADDKEMVSFLLDRPRMCSRFLHALDAQDNLDGALKVLKQLREADPGQFEKWQEFCIAFAVVWDDFQGHWWVDRIGPFEDGTMLSNYKYYLKNKSRLVMDPGELPFELGVYVVGTRLSEAERQWILSNVRPQETANPSQLYASVPWTKKLSPAHNTGEGIDYTLANIRQHGGVCMEQAYFSENVLRMHGIPAVYTSGRGLRDGHAWVGALMMRPKVGWDFSFGRYSYDHYYKGEVNDPTAPRSTLPDSVVKMSAALMKAGSIDKIEEGYFWCDAARWAADQPEAVWKTIEPEAAAPEAASAAKAKKGASVRGKAPAQELTKADRVRALLEKSLKVSPYNGGTWRYLSELAAQDGQMNEEQARFWAGKLFDLTIEEFPDFTVDCVDRFLACIKTPKEKAKLYSKMYTVIAQKRPDLAADIKIAEGDLWLEQKNVDKALESYLYPLVNFSKDKHVLDEAQKRLEGMNDEGDEAALEKAYSRVLKLIVAAAKARGAVKTSAPANGNNGNANGNGQEEAVDELANARKTVAKNLHDIYIKRGDSAKARKVEPLL